MSSRCHLDSLIETVLSLLFAFPVFLALIISSSTSSQPTCTNLPTCTHPSSPPVYSLRRWAHTRCVYFSPLEHPPQRQNIPPSRLLTAAPRKSHPPLPASDRRRHHLNSSRTPLPLLSGCLCYGMVSPGPGLPVLTPSALILLPTAAAPHQRQKQNKTDPSQPSKTSSLQRNA